MDLIKFDNLKITGEISVEPVPTNLTKPNNLILIVGPTGAGKSNFIETFAAKSQNLSISKDQLAGYTQQVDAYRLINVQTVYGDTVYLLDTPGFADTRISEKEVLDMIRKWLERNGLRFVNHVLFMMPINATRMSGSKRRTIEMLKEFLSTGLTSMKFVTTMWDALPNERVQQRAESNFVKLRDDILKEFLDGGAQIQQFMNTKRSALELLDTSTQWTLAFNQEMTESSAHRRNLYRDIHERIENALQNKKVIEFDLTQSEVKSNLELHAILEKNHKDNQETMFKFIAQWINFGYPPLEFRKAYLGLRKAIAADSGIQQLDPAYEDLFSLWERRGWLYIKEKPDELGHFSYEARSELKRQLQRGPRVT